MVSLSLEFLFISGTKLAQNFREKWLLLQEN